VPRHSLRLLLICALSATALSLTGCSGGSTSSDNNRGDAGPATNSTTSSASPAVPGSAAPEAPSAQNTTAAVQAGNPAATAASSLAAIKPGDTILCSEEGQFNQQTKSLEATFTISRYVSADTPPETVRKVSVSPLILGWGLPSLGCNNPTSWSPDFTKYLFAGVPPGGAASHIAVIDLAKGTLTDLTAPRQGSGFSDQVLNETDPSFISDTPTDKVTFGSNVVLFKRDNKLFTVDTRAPESDAQLSDTNGTAPGHPEHDLRQGVRSDFRRASPDGAFIADPANESTIYPAGKTNQAMTPVCPGMEGSFVGGTVLGWADATHAVYWAGSALGLVTVGDTLECESLLPATDKLLSDFQLLPDGSAVTFTAGGPNGDQVYQVATKLPAGEPMPGKALRLSYDALYAPGNY
jgi:hypothetical protein